ncbi:MAG: hypothetical protein HRT70_10220 [Flavobacteriaceae bacterium]|nr:hypothetical protein [Flavobacteriaceae bacterium]
MKKLIAVPLLLISSIALANQSCERLLQHGINNITKYKSANHTVAYKWHRNCGHNFDTSSDSVISNASVGLWGYGSGSAGYNSNSQRTKLRKWCDANSDFAESRADLVQEAQELSIHALDTFSSCIDMARKDIKIEYIPSGGHSSFVHFTVDSTHDGELEYFGIQSTNFECVESMTRNNHNEKLDPKTHPKIRNANIQIDCTRKKPAVNEVVGVGQVKYDEANISINTSGPSLSVYFPEVVTSYSVTPVGAIMAFEKDECPAGWAFYKPAFGRFLRGIDRSGKNIDVAGKRKEGSTQEDQFQDHKHKHGSSHWPNGGMYNTVRSQFAGGDQNHSTAAYGIEGAVGDGVRTGKETRPKNVAVTYCQRKIGS